MLLRGNARCLIGRRSSCRSFWKTICLVCWSLCCHHCNLGYDLSKSNRSVHCLPHFHWHRFRYVDIHQSWFRYVDIHQSIIYVCYMHFVQTYFNKAFAPKAQLLLIWGGSYTKKLITVKTHSTLQVIQVQIMN